MKMKTYLLAILLFLFSISPAKATVLSDAAAALAVGSWAEISLTTGCKAALLQPGTDGNIISYAAQFVWDSVRKRGYFVGNDHIDSVMTQDQRFVYYDEATNCWDNLPAGWSNPGVTDHAYYHNAIDTSEGYFYRRQGKDTQVIARFDIDGHTWLSDLPNNSQLSFTQCCGGLSYFREAGGLFWIQGDGGPGGAGACGGTNCGRLTYFSESTNGWITVQSNIPMAAQPVFMAYSGVHRILVFGDNAGHFWKMDQNRTLTQLASPLSSSVDFYDGTGAMGVMVDDPVSGDFLWLDASDRVFRKYNVLTDTWSTQSSTGKPTLTNLTIMAAPITNHGVIMYVYCAITNCHVYLYKHGTIPFCKGKKCR